MTVRMPQTTAYVMNNGLTLGSGAPQLTVHHRPPQVHAVSSRFEINAIYRLVSALMSFRLLLSVNCRTVKCIVDTLKPVHVHSTTLSPTAPSATNGKSCAIC